MPTAAALASHRLGPVLCREVSVEKVLPPQGEEEPDQGAFCLPSLLTPIHSISFIYLSVASLGGHKDKQKKSPILKEFPVINNSVKKPDESQKINTVLRNKEVISGLRKYSISSRVGIEYRLQKIKEGRRKQKIETVNIDILSRSQTEKRRNEKKF